jgi:hypothetical protein
MRKLGWLNKVSASLSGVMPSALSKRGTPGNAGMVRCEVMTKASLAEPKSLPSLSRAIARKRFTPPGKVTVVAAMVPALSVLRLVLMSSPLSSWPLLLRSVKSHTVALGAMRPVSEMVLPDVSWSSGLPLSELVLSPIQSLF